MSTFSATLNGTSSVVAIYISRLREDLMNYMGVANELRSSFVPIFLLSNWEPCWTFQCADKETGEMETVDYLWSFRHVKNSRDREMLVDCIRADIFKLDSDPLPLRLEDIFGFDHTNSLAVEYIRTGYIPDQEALWRPLTAH